MPITVQQLEMATIAALNWYYNKKKPVKQSQVSRPLFDALKKTKKTFASGKDSILVGALFDTPRVAQGYSEDDTVAYQDITGLAEARFPWKEIHGGFKVTETMLKRDGISIVDSVVGGKTAQHDARDETALYNMLETQIELFDDGYERDLAEMLILDGTQNAKEIPGVMSIVTTNPTAAVSVAGIDQVANPLWQNYAPGAITANPAAAPLAEAMDRHSLLQAKYRKKIQLEYFAGFDFRQAYVAEGRASGTLTTDGWRGSIDLGTGKPKINGKEIQWDPTLDALGLSKYCFALDMSAFKYMVMEGEDMKQRAPNRPENKYVYYRAVTHTAALICEQRNSSAVFRLN